MHLCPGRIGIGFRTDADHGTFRMYAFFGVCALTFFYFRVPETKNRSLEQIESEIRDERPGREQTAA
jgi:hypothetical protein